MGGQLTIYLFRDSRPWDKSETMAGYQNRNDQPQGETSSHVRAILARLTGCQSNAC
jgi:hypothetical protein